MSNIALETLIEKRDKLISEKGKLIEQLDEQINALTKTIRALGGEEYDRGTFIDLSAYGDENPDAIRGTEDGI